MLGGAERSIAIPPTLTGIDAVDLLTPGLPKEDLVEWR